MSTTEPPAGCGCHAEIESAAQKRVLWIVLAINGLMFLGEITAGLLAESTGLVADSFDMLADAAVYGLALAAVARGAAGKLAAARLSGVLQLALGAFALVEVGRRAIFGSEPIAAAMIGVAAVALVANVICLRLISRHRAGGVHMRASYIFSQNDVLANAAVIVGGLLVLLSGRALWDLAVGAGIGLLVLSGGVRIARDARATAAAAAASGAAGPTAQGGTPRPEETAENLGRARPAPAPERVPDGGESPRRDRRSPTARAS